MASTTDNILDWATETVDIDSLTPYPRNPRLGNVDVIAQSLRKNKQYRPITVNRRTMQVLTGNHTWMAAKQLGWDKIAAVFIDVDEDHAARIVVADNRTADLGTYDPELLAEIVAGLPDLEGTGYSDADRQLLLDAVVQNTEESIQVIDEIVRPATVIARTPEEMRRDEARVEATSGGSVGGIARPDLSQDEDEGLQQFDDHSSELRGVLQLREDAIWGGDNPLGLPNLLEDMLATEDDVPDLQTWVSRKITPDDGHSHYLYNYNLGSSVGIPYDRTVLGFFTHDDKFEGWWAAPARYMSKAINAGIKVMMVPDFSTYSGAKNDWKEGGMPPILNAMNIYRSLWLGRFFQEAGVKVIPNLAGGWENEWDLYAKYSNLPTEMPVAIVQEQTWDENIPSQVEFRELIWKQFLTLVKPQILYVYTGKPGRRLVDRMMNTYENDTEIRFLWSYSKIKNDEREKREADNKAFGETGLFTGDSKIEQEDVDRLKSQIEDVEVDRMSHIMKPVTVEED